MLKNEDSSDKYKEYLAYIKKNQPCLMQSDVVRHFEEIKGYNRSNCYYILNRLKCLNLIEVKKGFIFPKKKDK